MRQTQGCVALPVTNSKSHDVDRESRLPCAQSQGAACSSVAPGSIETTMQMWLGWGGSQVTKGRDTELAA